MSEKDEFEKALEYLEDEKLEYIRYAGGYPPIISTAIPGYVIVASVRDDKPAPELNVYTNENLLSAYRKMLKFRYEYVNDEGHDDQDMEESWEFEHHLIDVTEELP